MFRRLFSDQTRERIATVLGLRGFNRASATGRSLPAWAKEQVDRKTVKLDGVNIIGDLQADFGVSEVTRQMQKSLQAAGIPIAYQELTYAPQSRTNALTKDLTHGTPYHFNLIDIHFAHFYDAVMESPPEYYADKYNIAIWGWELPKFPNVSRSIFRLVDEVWVYSHYVQESIGQASPVPVLRMPPAITTQPNPSATRTDFDLPPERYIFFFSFSPASMIARKNPFAIIDAFRKAFGTQSTEAMLVIKTHHLDLVQDAERFRTDLQAAIDSVNGRLIHGNLSRQQMNDLIQVCDCYISLHRSEGFGLGMAEAMALGKPVIAPHYSGNADFMNASNSYGVRYTLRGITQDDHMYQPEFSSTFEIGQLWAEPDIDHAAELMRHVVTHHDEAKQVGEAAQAYIHQFYSAAAIGERIKERLINIADAR